MPITGRQSTIDKPESVKRVIPPTTIMIATPMQMHRNQSRIESVFPTPINSF